jgi:hypothetical protein
MLNKPTCFLLLLLSLFCINQSSAQSIIIDHTCTDITKIPDSWINAVKTYLKVQCAHASFGEQIIEGLERLSTDSKYSLDNDNCRLSFSNQHLNIISGQNRYGACETYVTPDLYWKGEVAINISTYHLQNADQNTSIWFWDEQIDDYSESYIQDYLDSLARLEMEFPNVTFVYTTGNAQSNEPNRFERNNQIRVYCIRNNKILFDFADLDAWYNNEQHIVNGIPMEHPNHNGDEGGHASYVSCDNKAKAFWWLLARITGWDGYSGGGGGVVIPSSIEEMEYAK